MNRRELLKAMSLLIGGAASGSLARAVVAAQSTARAPATPVFEALRKKQVAEIAELIIPTTDTPGAIVAGVPDFIEMMVGEWYTDTERTVFNQGLQELDIWCGEAFGSTFLDAGEAQRTEALRESERQASAYRERVAVQEPGDDTIDESAPFFHKIRELVIVGYYTSEVGARQEHKYFRMTPHFDGDYDLARIDGRQWSY
jgi:hypothetical protein